MCCPPPGQYAADGPRATGKWLTASVTDDLATVVAAGFGEAERRDPHHLRTWVVLVDGNNSQLDAVTTEAERCGVEIHIVIDFIHVLEYLWKAGWSFFETGDPDAEAWSPTRPAGSWPAGRPTSPPASTTARPTTATTATTPPNARAPTPRRLPQRQGPHLDYATALAAGWPIATSVIECACRHLAKDRMDITGARWGLDGAEGILTLRALIANGDFEDYWKFHLDQERHRNHHSQSANNRIPP